jgi:hypothetical protein
MTYEEVIQSNSIRLADSFNRMERVLDWRHQMKSADWLRLLVRSGRAVTAFEVSGVSFGRYYWDFRPNSRDDDAGGEHRLRHAP